MRRSQSVQFAVLLVSCTLAMAACTSRPAHTESDPAETTDPFAVLAADAEIMSHRWYASPDIDLDAPDIHVARAYIESEWSYWRTADISTAYPGYDDVTVDRFTSPVPRTGTADHHILEVRTVTFDGRPAIEVHICHDYMNTAWLTDTGWMRKDRHGYTSLRIQRTNWSTASRPQLDYADRMPYPTWNVFDGWDVHAFTDRRMDYGLPWRNCYSAMPGFDYDSPRIQPVPGPPPVEPFDPGWPTAIDPGTS